MTPPPMTALYPPLVPYRTFRLPVGARGLHELHVEESGNPRGRPVVCLHGGPGAGLDPGERQLFDPAVYRVIQLDQRGCGRSTPSGADPRVLEENTTWDLVADLETLRESLGIARWMLFGGSWGVTLALAYAELHPDRVTALLLRGVFLARPREIAWYYRRGASEMAPDHWERFIELIPENERGDLLRAYHVRLTSPNPGVQERAARAWATWELTTCSLLPDERLLALATSRRPEAHEFRLSLARLEVHYLRHGAWLEERPLLAHVDAIRHLPCTIVQGRYDLVCPLASAWALHRAWPEANLRVIDGAGHSAYEPGIERALLAAANELRFG
jgi:proline iminopeptidase